MTIINMRVAPTIYFYKAKSVNRYNRWWSEVIKTSFSTVQHYNIIYDEKTVSYRYYG